MQCVLRKNHPLQIPQKRSDKVLNIAGDLPARGTLRHIGEEDDLNKNKQTIVGLQLVG